MALLTIAQCPCGTAGKLSRDANSRPKAGSGATTNGSRRQKRDKAVSFLSSKIALRNAASALPVHSVVIRPLFGHSPAHRVASVAAIPPTLIAVDADDPLTTSKWVQFQSRTTLMRISFRQAMIAAAVMIGLGSPAGVAAPTAAGGDSAVPQPVRNAAGAGHDRAVSIEQRITDLHTSLQITPPQQSQWDQFAQVMRDSARDTDANFKTRIKAFPT